MDGRSRNNYEDLNPISKEERELELRLGPPGEKQDWSHHQNEDNKRERDDDDDDSSLSFGYFSTHKIHQNKGKDKASSSSSSFLELQSSTQNMLVMMGKESKDAPSQQSPCPKVVEEKKAFSSHSSANTNVPNSSQKRTASPGPVVGWPPIRSLRKNLPSSGSHQQKLHHVDNKGANNKEHVHNNVINKGLFVKINMDGVPIGRKVDINACGNYDKLCSAVDQLFRGLLAGQRDSCASGGSGIQNKKEEHEKVITGLLDHDGIGEYTLAFQDHQGHNMLVRDVPWQMFVSTVKRLRVLKSSDLSACTIGSRKVT